ncbi:MAG: hypothetical protein H0X39_08155 [Actinobacteria bacterium]|nr:hypothetical protein [Actinomycetota bacterium]
MRDRYQLGAQIVSSVSCGWITRWISAKRTGNALQVAEAVQAMTAVAGSRVLRQMDSSGAYPTVVREFAGAMAHGGNVVGPYAIGDQTVEDSYRSSLGCAQ